MKKRTLALTMAGLLTATSLVGCDVKRLKDDDGKQVIVKLGDQTYTADDLFADYSESSAAASEYFNAVYDVLVRDVQPITAEIENNVDKELTSFINTCQETATSKGITYKKAESDALEAKGVQNKEELEEVFTLQYQKTAFEKTYYEGVGDTEGRLDALLDEYIKYYAPYHVRHILVKTSGGESKYADTISETDAKNLHSVVSRLARSNDSDTFGNIALTTAANGDSGSAAEYGNLGIMDINTSYVPEFKYSVYQYDAFYNTATSAKVNAYNASQDSRKVGSGNTEVDYKGSHLIPSEYTTGSKSLNDKSTYVNYIPYDVFESLNFYSSVTTKKGSNEKVKDGDVNYYPRNVIWNEYLNDHRLGFITRGSLTGSDYAFAHIDGVSLSTAAEDDILIEKETGNPILVSRAGTGGDSGYQGIHFIVVQKSAFADNLNEYYTTNIDDLYDENKNVKPGYFATFLNTTRSEYEDEIANIKSKAKGFDSYMNYRMFERAVELSEAKHGKQISYGELENGVKVEEIISNYITSNRTNSVYNSKQTYEDSWEDYYYNLQSQFELQDSNLRVRLNTIGAEFGYTSADHPYEF